VCHTGLFLVYLRLRLLRLAVFRTYPNLPFLAKYPAFWRRFSFLAVRCLVLETIRPHLFIIRWGCVRPPGVLYAVLFQTCCLEPTSSLYVFPWRWNNPSLLLTGRFIIYVCGYIVFCLNIVGTSRVLYHSSCLISDDEFVIQDYLLYFMNVLFSISFYYASFSHPFYYIYLTMLLIHVISEVFYHLILKCLY